MADPFDRALETTKEFFNQRRRAQQGLSQKKKKTKEGNVIVVIDGKEYDVSNIGTKKNGKTTKSLQELKPAKPEINKPTGKILSFAKGGRAGYRMGGKCKLAKKGKGRAYGKNS